MPISKGIDILLQTRIIKRIVIISSKDGQTLSSKMGDEGTTMIIGLQHLSIIVSSEKSIEFYECLGFREISRMKRQKDTVVAMEGFGLRIVMFVDPTHPARISNPEAMGLRNLIFRVDQLEDTLREIKSNVEEAGLEIAIGPILSSWHGYRYVLIKDPDGLPIGLHE